MSRFNSAISCNSALFAERTIRAVDCFVMLSSVGLVVYLFWLFSATFRTFDFFSPYDLIEESAYTYTSVKNYLRFGVLNSWLLQDFSASPDLADHPFIYNHMPAGPDLLAAGMMWVADGNYQISRIALAVLAMIGFVIYLFTVYLLLKRQQLYGAGIVLFFVGPWSIIFMMGRMVYNAVPLLAFAPILFYLLYLQRPRVSYLVGAIVIIFISSLYIEYSLLSAVIACWIGFFATRLIPVRPKHIVAIGGAFAFGILLHLIQNFWFLGWDNALVELKMTLSNRVTGVPSQDEMKEFYRNLGLVHHGSHPIDWSVIRGQIIYNLRFPGDTAIAVAAMLLVLWRGLASAAWQSGSESPIGLREKLALAARDMVREAILLGSFFLWAGACVLIPILLFPAFAQEVSIRGSGAALFFLAVPVAAVIGGSLQVASRELFGAVIALGSAGRVLLRRSEREWPTARRVALLAARGVAAIALPVAAASAVTPALNLASSQLSGIRQMAVTYDVRDSLYELRRFQRALFMTNINSPIVGFLTDAAGFGVCGEKSIAKNGAVALDDCKIAFMRRYDYWRSQPVQYFYYFRIPELFPGFADCMPTGTMIGVERGGDSCMESLFKNLNSRYPVVYQNKIISVFSLSASPRANPSEN